jgi:hypothetical protein
MSGFKEVLIISSAAGRSITATATLLTTAIIIAGTIIAAN